MSPEPSSVASEVGKRCPVKGDPALQAALDESILKMDRHVTANGNWSADSIQRFKRQHVSLGKDTASLRTTDVLKLDEVFQSQGATAIQANVSKYVARLGKPTWGLAFNISRATNAFP